MAIADHEKPHRAGVVLVVDDDELFCDVIKDHLGALGMTVLTAHRGDEGLAQCSRHNVDVVLLDENLPDVKGHTLCPSILEVNELCKIIFVTAQPSFSVAVGALRAGAHDYLSKPVDLEELSHVVSRALKTLEMEREVIVSRYRGRKESQRAVLVGVTPVFEDLHSFVELAAAAAAPVLLTGETGSGKSVVARAIHEASPRSSRPFIDLNCAAVPEPLIEAELFGHSRGAFTGAVHSRRGVFEMAEGGTLLLDEIGEMPPNLQTKLLGVLEDGRVRRIGSEASSAVDVRVIAATNKPLHQLLEGTFRRDLYYRLSVLRFEVPPLRDRPGDIGPLCAHLLERMSRGRSFQLAEGELERLRAYHWPGNVRELRNVLERASILQPGPQLYPSRVIASDNAVPTADAVSADYEPLIDTLSTLEDLERAHIRRVLEAVGWNFSKAARTLGIALSTLKRKLKRYGFERPRDR